MGLDIQVMLLYPNQILYFHKCGRLSFPKIDTTTHSISHSHMFVWFLFNHVTLMFLSLGGGVYVFSMWTWEGPVSPSTNRVQWKWLHVTSRQGDKKVMHFCVVLLGQLFSEWSHCTMRKSCSYMANNPSWGPNQQPILSTTCERWSLQLI